MFGLVMSLEKGDLTHFELFYVSRPRPFLMLSLILSDVLIVLCI